MIIFVAMCTSEKNLASYDGNFCLLNFWTTMNAATVL